MKYTKNPKIPLLKVCVHNTPKERETGRRRTRGRRLINIYCI